MHNYMRENVVLLTNLVFLALIMISKIGKMNLIDFVYDLTVIVCLLKLKLGVVLKK